MQLTLLQCPALVYQLRHFLQQECEGCRCPSSIRGGGKSLTVRGMRIPKFAARWEKNVTHCPAVFPHPSASVGHPLPAGEGLVFLHSHHPGTYGAATPPHPRRGRAGARGGCSKLAPNHYDPLRGDREAAMRRRVRGPLLVSAPLRGQMSDLSRRWAICPLYWVFQSISPFPAAFPIDRNWHKAHDFWRANCTFILLALLELASLMVLAGAPLLRGTGNSTNWSEEDSWLS